MKTEKDIRQQFIQKRVKGEALSSLSTRQQDMLYSAERRIMDHIACTDYRISFTDCNSLDAFEEEHDIEELIMKADVKDRGLRNLIGEYLATVSALSLSRGIPASAFP